MLEETTEWAKPIDKAAKPIDKAAKPIDKAASKTILNQEAGRRLNHHSPNRN